jgi:hypothetical protein
LAPSPIDKHTLPKPSLTIFTTSAFCMGDTLQATTAWQRVHNCKKSGWRSEPEDKNVK